MFNCFYYQLDDRFHDHWLPNCTVVLPTGSDWDSHRIRTVRGRVGAGLARRGQWRWLVDYDRTPLRLSWRRRRGGEVVQGGGLALLAQAVVSQRPGRTQGLQSLGILVLGVGGRAGGSACRADTSTHTQKWSACPGMLLLSGIMWVTQSNGSAAGRRRFTLLLRTPPERARHSGALTWKQNRGSAPLGI